ncbi:MAG: hypothetical protein ABI137_16185 [Antricoccus sp.]
MLTPLVVAGASLALGAALMCWPSHTATLIGPTGGSITPASATDAFRFIQSAHQIATKSRRVLSVGAGLVCAIAVVGISIPASVAAGVLGGGVTYLVLDVLQTGRRNFDANRDIEGLRAIAAELRSGQSIDSALLAAASISSEGTARRYRAASNAVLLGADAIPGLLAGPAAGRSVGRVWRLAIATGCPIADLVSNLEIDAQSQRQHNRQIDALLAGPNATAALLAALPVFGLLMGSAIGANPLRVLSSTPIGGGALIVGTALTVAGILWTRFIVSRARGA